MRHNSGLLSPVLRRDMLCACGVRLLNLIPLSYSRALAHTRPGHLHARSLA